MNLRNRVKGVAPAAALPVSDLEGFRIERRCPTFDALPTAQPIVQQAAAQSLVLRRPCAAPAYLTLEKVITRYRG